MANGKGEATAILKMRGMSDSGWARQLKRRASDVDGIIRVDINYILDSATVRYDANKLNSAQVKKKLGQNYRTQVTRKTDPQGDSTVG
jgi:copper chaperone CopZ